KEIEAFVAEEYWKVKAQFEKDDIAFEAELSHYKNKKIELTNETDTTAVYESLNKEFVVDEVKKSLKKRTSKPPFITSTLQQEASSKLNFKAKRTMMIAQKLYEGIDIGNETVGLITYMRTDSIRLSDSFIGEAKDYIGEKYGKDYVGSVKVSKKKENVQDAHEGIRPTSVLRTPESLKEYLKPEELKLYSLIYARAIASLMAPAQLNSTTLSLSNNDYLFKASGSVIKFDGYLRLYGQFEKQTDEILPDVLKDEVLVSQDIQKTQHFTKPPARYSEAKLIKELEELGVGRPSTYASIIDTIQTRDYVEVIDKAFKPTESGTLTNDKLVEYFDSIINVEYTANMEKNLDGIAEGEDDYVHALTTFEDKFEPLLENAYDKMEQIQPKKTGEVCPECGGELVERKGKFGTFVACGNYPECKYVKKEPDEIQETGEACPKCGSPMIFKKGRFGQFEACSNYPECKYIKNDKKSEPKETDEVCPNCGSPIVIKRGRFGEFKACSGYPKCKTIIK
ncbi:MAG: type I DNA topoisomerase, partial [Coprobacillus sp.]